MLERDDFAKRYRGGVADLAHGVPLPVAPGDRLGRGACRRGARRHRPAVQPHHGPPSPEAGRPGASRSCSPRRCSSVSTASRRCRSRSGNYVGIDEAPAEQFGKLMSIPDALMPNYFQYATDWPPEQIAEVLGKLESGDLHPNTAKRMLARAVVDLYHGAGCGSGGRGRVRPGVQGPRRARGDSRRIPGRGRTRGSSRRCSSRPASRPRTARRCARIDEDAVKLDGERRDRGSGVRARRARRTRRAGRQAKVGAAPRRKPLTWPFAA